MASFIPSVTDIKFAGGRTGYKNITITNPPAGGIQIQVLGAGASYFRVSVITSGSEYKVETKTTNLTNSSIRAFLRIFNSDDHSDYVDVWCEQYGLDESIKIYGDDIYKSASMTYGIDHNSDSFSTDIYADTDGTTPTKSVVTGSDWLSINMATQALTDTGFIHYIVSGISNYSGSTRTGEIDLTDSGNTYIVYVNQEAGSPTWDLEVTPSSMTNVSANGWTRGIVLTYRGSSYSYNTVLSWVSLSMNSPQMTGLVSGSITIAPNSSTALRSGNVYFTDAQGSIAMPITQLGQYIPLTVLPSSLTFGENGGSSEVNVQYAGTLTTNSLPDWVTRTSTYVDSSHTDYNITVSSNTSTSARSCTWWLTDDNTSVSVPITQVGITPTLTISPSSLSVGYGSGTFSVGVSQTGLTTVNATPQVGWIGQVGPSVSNVYTFSYDPNSTTTDRDGTIVFSGGNLHQTFTLYQQSSPAPSLPTLDISPLSSSVGYSLGSTTVAVTTTNVSTVTATPDVSWITCTPPASGIYYTVVYSTNSTTSQRTGFINFLGTGPGGVSSKTYTLTQAGQEPTPAPVVSINPPSEETVDYQSGSVTVSLRVMNVTTVTASPNQTWIRQSGTAVGNVFTFEYDANTGSSQRDAEITFTGTGPGGSASAKYKLHQIGQTQPVMEINPTNETINKNSRMVRVTVYTENIDSVTYNIGDSSWLVYSSMPTPGTYAFICSENTGSSSRTNTVTFSGGGISKVYTLTQTGTTPVPAQDRLKAIPDRLRFYSDGDTVVVRFKNWPDTGVSYDITYTDGSGWLTISSVDYGLNVVCGGNTGNSRRAVIRFYETGDQTNYVDVPVIQGSGVVYWDSIWVENIFTPNVQDDYHYNIMISNPHFNGSFEGLTPIPYQGIDVPRIVEDYISSNFEPQVGSVDWASLYTGYCMASIYNLNGSTPVLEGTYSFWNDWSGKEKRYDYTKSINDPINHKGTSGMIIPFCVYYDSNDNTLFSTLVTDMEGNSDTYTYSTPLEPFNMRTDVWYNVKQVDYRLNDQVLFSYDMTHCGGGAFIYRNRFGGWDSFLIEGNISKTDNYTKLNYKTKGIYNSNISSGYNYNEKRTYDVDIDTTYEAYTGWLADDEAERLVFHLASSPKVYFQDLVNPSSDLIPIRMTLANAEYKKFRNGRRLINYTILFEKAYTEKLKD